MSSSGPISPFRELLLTCSARVKEWLKPYFADVGPEIERMVVEHYAANWAVFFGGKLGGNKNLRLAATDKFRRKFDGTEV